MNVDLMAGIVAGLVLGDFYRWCAGKVKHRRQQKKAEQDRAAAQAETQRKLQAARAEFAAGAEADRRREAARVDRIAKAMADLTATPFMVETSNEQDFVLAVRKVYFSLRALDNRRRFFCVYNNEAN